MPANLARIFHALNGAELKKIILDEIATNMSRDTDFGQHLTYMQVEYEFVLTLKLTPREAQDKVMRVEGGRAEHDEDTKLPVIAATPRDPRIISIQSSRVIDLKETPPDKLREEAGLQVPQPQMVGGQIVDVPAATDVTEERHVTVKKGLARPSEG
jgi:hypothetical protein